MPGRRKINYIPIKDNRVIEAGNGITFTDISAGSNYRGQKTDAVAIEITPVALNTVQDNANGTTTINQNSGGVQDTIRPINELIALSGAVDTINDKLVLWDASTNTHVFVAPSAVAGSKKFRIVTGLVAGANVITHNLGLTAPFATIVEVRNNITGALVATRVTAETANTITINVPVAQAGVRVTILG